MPPNEYDITHVHVEPELLTEAIITEHQIGPGEEIFTTGMFNTVLGTNLNRPIVRIGTIAAMPAEPIETRSGYSLPSYLVEVRSIAGLSGSPVFVHMAPLRVLRGRTVTETVAKTHYFLGVMQGAFHTSDATDMVSPDEDFAPGDMNAGIGVVTPGTHVMELLNIPELKDARERIVVELAKKSE